MSPVWVNGKFLDESINKKAEKWKPDPEPERKLWGQCACGTPIYDGDPVGMHGDHVRVVCYTCWMTGDSSDLHLDCCGLQFPDATLSN